MTNANALTKLKKARRGTLSAQIVEQMETCIKDGVWPIGEKVPSEMELMETFGVSRNTVREAILALVYAGILQSYPGDGTYVLSDGRLDAALQLRIKAARLSEIVETRMILETDIARYAAERGTAADLDRLLEVKQARERPDLDQETFIQYDQEFHLKIAEQCHNSLLYDVYKSFLCGFNEELLGYYLNRPDTDRQHREHHNLFLAISEHRGDDAARIVKNLLETEKRLLQDSLELNRANEH